MKKLSVINIVVLLGLMLSVALADDINSLVQLDLKRTSNDTVNVTLFTTNNYNDNVMVRKKSDNKYVILIPKIQSSGYSASNLNGVRDLISNVDVKTVNDTSGGYTKITLITTKPLEIKTSARKSAPVTAEQRETQTLIAQANAVKNNISTQNNRPKLNEQKTEVTVNKASSEKPVKKFENKKTEPVKQEVKKTEINLVEVDPEIMQRRARKQSLEEMKQEIKLEQAAPEILPEQPVIEDISEEVQDIKKMYQELSMFSKIKNRAKNLPKKARIAILALLGISALIKLLKNNAKSSYVPQEAFIDSVVPSKPEYNKVNDILENPELSWKEKYQMYLDKSAVPVSRGENKGNYTFIKTPNIEQKRENLERLVTEPIYNELNKIEPEIVESEDEVIQKTIKLKAFDNRAKSLKMTNRDKGRFKKYEVEIPLHEQKNIELGDSLLHSNPRSFAGANLKIADVDKKRIKYEPKEYIMSSIDEYFSILDKEQPKVTVPKLVVSSSNPIARHRNENKSSYLKGLIVKSGFNIDDSKGFYLVNKDGQNALVGKVNEEVFVLKKFDKNITSPMQVRRDKDNVYMVKAGNFKSLVEVDQDKMGVLIEL